jgi:hypothetical protein
LFIENLRRLFNREKKRESDSISVLQEVSSSTAMEAGRKEGEDQDGGI